MQMNQNGRTVLERRYLVKDEHGENIETVEGLFRRVADAIAEADRDFDPKADVEGLLFPHGHRASSASVRTASAAASVSAAVLK